jgi:hypothetical protein
MEGYGPSERENAMSNAIRNDVRELKIEELELASGGETVVITNHTPKGTLVIVCATDGVVAKWIPK